MTHRQAVQADTEARTTAEASEHARLHQAECTIASVRWFAITFALFQALTYYRPYPSGMLPLALGVIAALAIGNLVLVRILRRSLPMVTLKRVSIVSLTLDLLIVMAFVFVFTFDVDTAIWALIYILPLGGAIRFQRVGALAVTAAATVLYTVREIFGYLVYDNEFLPVSITFRMGIAFIIAYVAGTTAGNLLRERRIVEAANKDLAEMNKTMREFVSIASHDMRTPLSVISGLSTFMGKNWDTMPANQRQELIAAIERQSGALDRLVNDLLTTSSLDVGSIEVRPQDVGVNDAINTAVDSASLSVDVEVDTGEAATMHADPDHVCRILVNFLNNAEKYGGPPIAISTRHKPGTVDICVGDNGDGVPSEFVPRLFERFARAANTMTERQDGTGLGLAIVKGLAEHNGGTVWYEPNQPRGALFCLRLPASGVDESVTQGT